MHRIDGAGATTQNLFTEGDPTQAIPATTVTGAWLNAVQEEIADVIEQAGIELDKADNTQLHAAILAIIAANQQTGFSTGDVKLTLRPTADAGWVLCDDGTIGDAGSAASNRANADTEALYTLLWDTIADAYAPVSGGRGASAADDFAAGKPIALTRVLGRALGVAGGGAGLSVRSLGEYLGEETHQLAVGEMPAHSHGVNDPGHGHGISDPGHSHSVSGGTMGDGSSAQGFGWSAVNSSFPEGTSGNGTGISIQGAATGLSVQAAGGGGAHNTMQPTAFLNAMVKL